MKRALAVLSCAVLLMSCSGKDDSASPGGGSPTTPTTAALGPTAPLTGLPEADAAKRDRPLLTVKIDNHPEARPQFGIDQADVIVEEKVEGGLSRFMALFQSADADKVGPVRSLRSTDAKWLKPEGGMIAYSGGIDPVKALLPSNGIVDLGADNHGARYYKRRSDRPFEHSMYVSTPILRELTPKNAKPPAPLFDYVDQGQAFGGTTAVPVSSVSLRMGGTSTAVSFDWTWDAASGLFKRGTDAKPHSIENQGQIGMKNVVVQFTSYSATPWRDRANSPVDEANVVGSGDAWILSDGKIVKGRWTRADSSSVTKYTDSTGAPVAVQRGKSWISMVPPGELAEVR